jgi:hypothetical protein
LASAYCELKFKEGRSSLLAALPDKRRDEEGNQWLIFDSSIFSSCSCFLSALSIPCAIQPLILGISLEWLFISTGALVLLLTNRSSLAIRCSNALAASPLSWSFLPQRLGWLDSIFLAL